MTEQIVEQTSGGSSYFERYYKANRQRISDKRKKLYASDPAYAEKAKIAAKRYRIRLKKERRASGVKKQKRGRRIPETMLVGGIEQQVFTIKQVAKQLRRSVATLNYWERNGLLSEPPIRLGRVRMYTAPMIEVVREALKKRGRVDLDDVSFRDEVKTGWNAIDCATRSQLPSLKSDGL